MSTQSQERVPHAHVELDRDHPGGLVHHGTTIRQTGPVHPGQRRRRARPVAAGVPVTPATAPPCRWRSTATPASANATASLTWGRWQLATPVPVQVEHAESDRTDLEREGEGSRDAGLPGSGRERRPPRVAVQREIRTEHRPPSLEASMQGPPSSNWRSPSAARAAGPRRRRRSSAPGRPRSSRWPGGIPPPAAPPGRLRPGPDERRQDVGHPRSGHRSARSARCRRGRRKPPLGQPWHAGTAPTPISNGLPESSLAGRVPEPAPPRPGPTRGRRRRSAPARVRSRPLVSTSVGASEESWRPRRGTGRP